MSEIQNNQGLTPADNQHYASENHNEHQEGIAFKGEKTDLRYEPGSTIKRSWVHKPIRTKIENHTIEIGSKQINQVHEDLAFMGENSGAVERAVNLFPAFQEYAESKGFQNPDSLALALEHYAATNEFVANTELDLDED